MWLTIAFVGKAVWSQRPLRRCSIGVEVGRPDSVATGRGSWVLSEWERDARGSSGCVDGVELRLGDCPLVQIVLL